TTEKTDDVKLLGNSMETARKSVKSRVNAAITVSLPLSSTSTTAKAPSTQPSAPKTASFEVADLSEDEIDDAQKSTVNRAIPVIAVSGKMAKKTAQNNNVGIINADNKNSSRQDDGDEDEDVSAN